MVSTLQLDHVVVLLPYQDVAHPPSWITDSFTLSDGGRHADGKTENKLVLFQDGTYLELIAFINDDPEKRRGHWWDKPYGVVDYALTTDDPSFGELTGIRERLSKGTNVSYTDPQAGGRIKPDGTELKWKVTFPTGTERGSVPFFCHDVTPRERRVPVSKSSTSHPCGAVGMAGVLLQVVGDSLSSHLASATKAILDSDSGGDASFGLSVPHQVEGSKVPSVRITDAPVDQKQKVRLSLVLQTPKKIEDIQHAIDGNMVSILFEQV